MKFDYKKMDRVFSWFIRLRDSDENGVCRCITCGKPYYFKDIDNGHYRGRQYWRFRYNEKNCHAQCKACNKWGEGRKDIYAAVIRERYGENTLNILKSKGKGSKPKPYEAEVFCKIYAQRVLDLLDKKNLDEDNIENYCKRILK